MIDDDYIREFDGTSVFQIKFEFQPVASAIKIEKGPSILHTTNGNVTENLKLRKLQIKIWKVNCGCVYASKFLGQVFFLHLGFLGESIDKLKEREKNNSFFD